MGRGDANNASRYGDIVAVCDVDDSRAEAAAKQFTKNGKVPAKYSDFRKVLERDDVHVVIQATPDHWHTLVNLAVAKAKKDVYGEKPLTLTIDEGKRLVKAVRDNKTILQTGSQQRSDRRFRLACELVRNERIGKLKQVTVYLPAGLRGGPFAASTPPAGLNWEYWLGQAPKVDYVKERCHTTFRYWLDYSGGTMTDWGAHHNDIARWAIGLEGPIAAEAKVLSAANPGRLHRHQRIRSDLHLCQRREADRQDDARTTTFLAGWSTQEGQRNGLKFEGTDGWIWVTRGDMKVSNEELLTTPLPESATKLEVSSDHMGNFFDCVRSRKDPIARVEVGHRSACICHLAAIALRLGRKLQWDPDKELFTGDGASEANAYVAREMRKPYDYTFV